MAIAEPVLTLLRNTARSFIGQEIVAEDHIGLVYAVAQKYVKKGYRIQDSEEFSDGCLGLINAVENFEPKLGFRFSTFATNLIRNEILSGYRRRLRQKTLLLRDADESEPQRSKQQKVFAREEYDPDQDPHVLAKRALEACPAETEGDRLNKAILIRHYLRGESYAEIARRLGVTTQRVQQRADKALGLIKKNLNVDFDLQDRHPA